MTAPTLRLRAYRPEEYDWVLDRVTGVHGSSREQRLERLRASGGRYHTETLFGIEAEGRLVGEIQARYDRNMMPPGVFDIGIELWDEADRGRGFGKAAVAALLTLLFEEENAERVQGSTDLDNAAMRGTFESLGFTYEGTLRNFMPTPSGRRDYASYAITRGDWAST